MCRQVVFKSCLLWWEMKSMKGLSPRFSSSLPPSASQASLNPKLFMSFSLKVKTQRENCLSLVKLHIWRTNVRFNIKAALETVLKMINGAVMDDCGWHLNVALHSMFRLLYLHLLEPRMFAGFVFKMKTFILGALQYHTARVGPVKWKQCRSVFCQGVASASTVM